VTKTTRRPGRRIAVGGEVVELVQRAGVRWARVLLSEPAVLEIPIGSRRDLHLGDRLVVRGLLHVERVDWPAGAAARGTRR
jgi:hypothetical protein